MGRWRSSYLIISDADDQRRYHVCVTTDRQATAGQRSPSPEDGGSPRLGYLLKQAQLRYGGAASIALEPLGIRPHEWAALSCLDEPHQRSQKQIAELLGIDRTTMVALVDDLQVKGLVRREPQAQDRRKNIVSLTSEGRKVMHRGARLLDDCERRFLAALSAPDAERLKQALATVIAGSRQD
jgi:DNA-binding MarR family transcriptional regulator